MNKKVIPQESLYIDGTLNVSYLKTDSGDQVRVSFVPNDKPEITFACWTKLQDLCGDALLELGDLKPEHYRENACMISFSGLTNAIVKIMKKARKKANGVVKGAPWM